MNLLFVNADDGGLDESTDDAILRCARASLVRNASVVANGPTSAAFVERAKDAGLDLGLHVNLTQGEALAGPASTITDPEGRFLAPKTLVWERARRHELDFGEVRAEVRAQFGRLRELGVEPSHVDGHNHVHLFPSVRAALAELAKGLWIRVPRDVPPYLPAILDIWSEETRGSWRSTDRFSGYGFSERPEPEEFLAGLAGGGSVEFMVHPGRRPGSAFTESRLRDRECEVLCSPALLEEVELRGYRIATFRET